MQQTEKGDKGQSRSSWPLLVSIAVLAIAVAAYFLVPSYQSFVNEAWNVLTSNDEQRIQQWVGQFGMWGPLLIVVLMTVQMFLVVVPSWALMVVSVLAYGVFWGAVISIVAVSVASSVGYAVGRYVGEVTVYRLVGQETAEKIDAAVQRHGLISVVLIRLAPFLSNDAISFVGGMLRMGFLRFMAATLLGITPLMLLIGWFGKDWETMKSGLIWGSAAALLAYAGYLGWRYWRRETG